RDQSWSAASAEPSEGTLAAALAEQFAAVDRDNALADLNRNGIPATVVNHLKDLFNDPQVLANQLIAELPHSEWGRVKQTGVLIRFSATPCVIERAAPLLGEHTYEILRDHLGYDSDRIAALRQGGIIK